MTRPPLRRRVEGRIAEWIDRYDADRCPRAIWGVGQCVRKPAHRGPCIVEAKDGLRVWNQHGRRP